MEARKLVFAQLLVSGQTSGGREIHLIKGRNTIAIEEMMRLIAEEESVRVNNNEDDIGISITSVSKSNSELKSKSYALLYGAMHCQDLQSRLQTMGYSVSNVEWRTAWSVSVPTFGTDDRASSLPNTAVSDSDRRVGGSSWGNFALTSDPNDIGVGLVLVPLYLIIGGLDWLGTVQDIAYSLDGGAYLDGSAIAMFYLMRHLAMYLGLSKFVVEWDGEVRLFGDSAGVR